MPSRKVYLCEISRQKSSSTQFTPKDCRWGSACSLNAFKTDFCWLTVSNARFHSLWRKSLWFRTASQLRLWSVISISSLFSSTSLWFHAEYLRSLLMKLRKIHFLRGIFAFSCEQFSSSTLFCNAVNSPIIEFLAYWFGGYQLTECPNQCGNVERFRDIFPILIHLDGKTHVLVFPFSTLSK